MTLPVVSAAASALHAPLASDSGSDSSDSDGDSDYDGDLHCYVSSGSSINSSGSDCGFSLAGVSSDPAKSLASRVPVYVTDLDLPTALPPSVLDSPLTHESVAAAAVPSRCAACGGQRWSGTPDRLALCSFWQFAQTAIVVRRRQPFGWRLGEMWSNFSDSAAACDG
jgi:hypothetical protein